MLLSMIPKTSFRTLVKETVALPWTTIGELFRGPAGSPYVRTTESGERIPFVIVRVDSYGNGPSGDQGLEL